MKAAILGAANALGARVIESFELGEGPSVAAIGRHASQLAAAARFSIDLRVADVLDVASLARSFSGCSVGVHALTMPDEELKASVVAFCRAGAQAGLRRLIYISSVEVHGDQPTDGSDEKSPLLVRHESTHTDALVVAELQFGIECRQSGIAGIVLRPGLIYGARCPWFTAIVAELRQDRGWLSNQGEGICNCVFIDHVVTAIRLALQNRIPADAVFTIVDIETITWRHFYEALALELHCVESVHYLGGAVDELAPPTLSAEVLARHHCTWKFPSTRAAKDLAGPSAESLAERIRRSVAWWRFAQGDFSVA